jgi:hypothetical protein
MVKAWWLIAAFLSGFALAMLAEDLVLGWHDDRIEFTAPRLHFLSGKPLERLKNAAEVGFDFQITLWSGNRTHVFRKSAERFVVSYDLWEEKFSVSKLQAPRRTASHLTAPGAEAWCLEQMSMDPAGVAGSEPLWARLEIRAEDGKGSFPFGRGGRISESGISLTGLVDVFSRPPQVSQTHWSVEAGPITLDELRRSPRRGS